MTRHSLSTSAQASFKRVACLELTYRGKPADPPQAKFGTYLGRGDGRVSGSVLNGAVTWDLFEIQGAASCDANMIGTISTDDNARLDFELLGFFKREGDTPKWQLISSFRLASNNPVYQAFDGMVGWVDGHFDAASYSHRYDLLVKPNVSF